MTTHADCLVAIADALHALTLDSNPDHYSMDEFCPARFDAPCRRRAHRILAALDERHLVDLDA